MSFRVTGAEMDKTQDDTFTLPTNETSFDAHEEKKHLVRWIIPPIVLVTFAVFLVVFIYHACIAKTRQQPASLAARSRVEQVNQQWQTTLDGSLAPGDKEKTDKPRVVRFEGVIKES